MRTKEDQAAIDQANSAFWSTLCGDWLGRAVGATERTPEALRRYDDAFLSYYPYLLPFVRPWELRGKTVVEFGLGYGTLGAALARHAGRYIGIDIAPSPAAMMSFRLRAERAVGVAIRGSVLAVPLADASVDAAVSIGCIHHSGDPSRAAREIHRILRPGGRAVVMVYNDHSLWRLLRRPWPTLRGIMAEQLGRPLEVEQRESLVERGACDLVDDVPAPETQFFSRRGLAAMFGQFSRVEVVRRNADDLQWRGKRVLTRDQLLAVVGALAGLDLYVEAWK